MKIQSIRLKYALQIFEIIHIFRKSKIFEVEKYLREKMQIFSVNYDINSYFFQKNTLSGVFEKHISINKTAKNKGLKNKP